MSRQLDLVVQGVLGTNPAVTRTSAGRAYCYFRLATSPSYRTSDGWQDGRTIWFTAKAWGPLAENLGRSLHKGDPVVLVGRFTQESWFKGSEEFFTNVLTVSCGGHDLTRGETRFMRIVHRPDTTEDGETGAAGAEATSSSGSAGSPVSAPSADEAARPVPASATRVEDPYPAPAPGTAGPAAQEEPVPVIPPTMTAADEPDPLEYMLADEEG